MIRPMDKIKFFETHNQVLSDMGITEDNIDEFIDDNMGLAIDMWKKKYQNCITYPEALVLGYIALKNAAERWDPSKGKFSTYSYFWLRKFFLMELTAKKSISESPYELFECYEMSDDGAFLARLYNKTDVTLIKEVLMQHGLTKDEYQLFYDKHAVGLNNFSLLKLHKHKFTRGIQYELRRIHDKIIDILKATNEY